MGRDGYFSIKLRAHCIIHLVSNIYFTVGDWGENGALRLQTQVEDVDVNCTSVPGFTKVCSGNYSDTSWKGINEWVILSPGRTIQSSRARMNEYYVNPAASGPTNDNEERQAIEDEAQYVMCHELGHAWGLVHTDEDFDNEDTGNCLDYTRSPGTNKEPGQVNLDILAGLYGTPDAADDGDDNNNRRLQRTVRRRSGSSTNNRLRHETNNIDTEASHPNWLLDEMEQVYDDHSGRLLQPHLWKRLHSSPHSQVHQVSLSNGHTLRVQKLLA
mmetsp:Transcript_21898/g.50440  ORF Transcript_21898/g.50440 Transcript_21898/m.50440 type:complete len:271 (+) Transcript_21898:1720-2532(+)